MMLALLALILRPVGFKYRSKLENPRWRGSWDAALCFSGTIAALVFGVAMGNVILGVPSGFDPDTMRPVYSGHFFQLFTPFALLAGVLSVTLVAMHGAALLAWRTEDRVAARARRWGARAALLSLALFLIGGFWVAYGIQGHAITSLVDPGAPSNPLTKSVALQTGGWLRNFTIWPAMWLAPAAGACGALLTAILLSIGRAGLLSFLASSASFAGVILPAGFALFPFILPSSSQPAAGLTVWDASSSHLTLWIMLLATLILLPIVTAYTAWVYRVMRGKVTAESIDTAPHAY
jgi:cytochrome d ubiquinol oxidase subunit II